MGKFSLLEFAAFATELVVEIDHAKAAALEKAAKIIEKEAKRVIGTYDYEWPQLAERTQEERARLGFSENEPLLRTGELRDSISTNIVKRGEEATIGSSLKRAIYQELGTATIPPRSFLVQAAVHKEKEIYEKTGARVTTTIVTGRAPDELVDE